MRHENLAPSWYALTVKPQHEVATARNLRTRDVEGFAPVYRVKRQWCDRVKEVECHLFPGYVFSHFSYAQRMSVLNTPGVTSIVSFGKTPAAIADEEIASVQRAVASRLPVEPWPYARVGQKIRILAGCLEGVAGTLLRDKDAWRVIVSVELLQRSVAVEIDRELISPVELGLSPPFYPAPSPVTGGMECPS